MKGKGVDRLAQALDARIGHRTDRPSPMDLGTIQEDGGLQLDQFGPVIPRSGYLVAEWLMDIDLPPASRLVRLASSVSASGDDTGVTTYSPLSRLDFAGGENADHIPDASFRFSPALQPGDRVLALWVRNEPIVISKVVNADA